MPKTLAEVTEDAAELAERDRLKLARILLELSESDSNPANDVEEAWDKETERRLLELRSDRTKGVPLEEVKNKN